VIRGFARKDQEKQIRPMLARQVWFSESNAPVVSCGRDLALAVAFVENTLTKSERKGFQEHLLDCRHCRQFVSSEVRIRRPLIEEPHVSADTGKRFFISFRMKWALAGVTSLLLAVTAATVMIHSSNSKPNAVPQNTAANVTYVAVTAPRPAVVDAPSDLHLISKPGLTLDVKEHSTETETQKNLVAEVTLPSVPDALVKGNETPATSAENANFKIDASQVASLVPATSGKSDLAEKDSLLPAEYSVQVEPVSLQSKVDDPKTRATDLKIDSLPGSLESIDRASIIIPQSVPDEGNHSEVVIVTHSQLPASMLSGRTTANEINQQFSQFRSGNNNQANTNTFVFGGKWFTQVDKVWIDRDFAANSDMPVIKVKVKSPEGRELLSSNPGLRPFLQLRRQILVVYEGKVYITY